MWAKKVAILLLPWWAACLPPMEQAAQSQRSCTPGEEAFCLCRGGRESGMKRCDDDGRGFGPCERVDGEVCGGFGDGEDGAPSHEGGQGGGEPDASPATTVGSGGAPGECAHEPCLEGEALAASCDPCVAAACDAQPWCCEDGWDASCVEAAKKICHLACEPPAPSCAHETCAAGAKLDPTCDACVASVCKDDAFCCETEWDALCVTEATEICKLGCACVHAPCAAGAGLAPSCDPCVAKICASDAFCCDYAWDSLCVSQAKQACGC